MGPLEREEARRRTHARLAALKQRAVRLRRRVVAVAAIGFAALWIVVSVQMATGHDPVLSRPAANVTAAAGESVANDPERRDRSAATPAPAEIERSELEATALAEEEQLEAEIAEVEELELEAVTTSQS